MTQLMNSRERFFAALSAQEVDKIPVSFSANAVVNRMRSINQAASLAMSAKERARIFIEGHEQLGSDVIHAGFNGTMSVRAIGGNVLLSDRHSPSLDEPLINVSKDVDRVDLDKLQQDSFYKASLEIAKAIADGIQRRMALSVGSYGPFTLAGLLYGSDRFMRAVIRDKGLVRAILDVTIELYLKNVEEFLDYGADIAFIAEPSASGDMVSRKIFDELASPAIRRVTDEVEKKGKASCLHICGNITDRLSSIPDTGADVISLDYKVSLSDARRVLGDSYPLGGNADPVAIMADGAPQDVTDAFRECLRDATKKAYIIMPGCTLPARTPRENIDAMTKCAVLD